MHTFDFRRFTPAALGLAGILLASTAGAQLSVPKGATASDMPKFGHFVVQPSFNMNVAGKDEKVILNPKVLGNPLAFRPIYQNKALSGAEYQQMKQQAGALLSGRPDPGAGSTGISPMTSYYAALKYSTFGIDNAAAAGPAGYGYLWIPPDVQAAFGPNSAVQPANSGIRVYNKTATNTLSTYYTTDLNSWTGMPATENGYLTAMFDPDSYYDTANGGHFVVTADAFPWLDANNNFHQYLFVVVSSTNDARGSWGEYVFDVGQIFKASTPSPGWTFFDYPHVGFDQGNIIITGNLFDDYYGGYYGAAVIVLNKTQAYTLSGVNGNAWAYNYSSNSGYIYGTLMPPRVISQGSQGYSYLEAAQVGSGYIGEYTLKGTAGSSPALVGMYTGVATGLNLSFPPLASDPGGNLIDTLDGRIQHSPTQNGDLMFATTTVNLGGFPTVQAYEFNGYTGGLTGQMPKYIYAGTSSDDFNPSIAANSNNSWVISWNSTGLSRTSTTLRWYEATNFTSFHSSTDTWAAANTKGKIIKKSTLPDYMGRNGDYSSVQVDPNDPRRFWLANQLVSSGSSYEWATNLASVLFAIP